MNYKHTDGKTYRIPDQELKNNMKFLKISLPEAIKVWLEDNGKEVNAEQEALMQKAKDNKITATIHQAKAEYTPKTQKERVQKEDKTKENFITALAELLTSIGATDVQVLNKTKLIGFQLGTEKFELDFKRKRPPKAEKG